MTATEAPPPSGIPDTTRHTGRPRQPRLYPLEPLLQLAGVRPWQVGTKGRILYRVRSQEAGLLTEAQADRWALRLGFHPAQVWADWLRRGEA